MESKYPGEAGSSASSSVSWSWTVCVFISGIFFGTILGILLYWKSSLQAKFWALLGHLHTDPAPPLLQEDTDSSESLPQITPSSSQRIYKYDVFISFRGSDTRSRFVDHLYREFNRTGISTFIDDLSLRKGESIPSELIQAINDSRVYVVVLSKRYASSPFCLDEMAAIADCHQELGQPIVPIYYDVDPSDVRHQKGPYHEAFVLHAERFKQDPDKVNRWRCALKVLSTLSGWDLRNKVEYKEIEKIAGQIVQDLTDKRDKFSRFAQDVPTDVYDVFLSFKGSDTRNKFTYHLRNSLIRHGISVLKDDDELEIGETISSQLLQTIKDSRISIVVFSRDYANSTWCLDEMTTIADCCRESKQIVIPVFYDVDPSDVRKQKGHYEKAFVSLSKRFRKDPDKLHRWKEAMTYLASFSGFHIRDKPEFIEIENIVQRVMDKLGHKLSRSIDDLAGIKARVEELEKLLKLSSKDDGFRVLGICGMGGIGKTTHAKALYDIICDRFDGCCFIEDVRKIYEDGGAIAVQKQILRQTLNEKNLDMYSHSEISRIIRNRLSLLRVLIVLDDVGGIEQLAMIPKLLGKGSRIIVTTRDKHILQVYGADAVYDVPLLNHNEARELFVRKAFNSDISSSNMYIELVPKVLEYAQGLPLAITVMASFLCNKDAAQWKVALERLSLMNLSKKDIMDVLKESFDSLNQNEKDIFLHIACFFDGQSKEYVLRILDTCGLYPRIGIQVLLDKSLIAIKNRKVHMHDMVQELGRKIVREECLKEPGQRSRLWLYEDFEYVLMNQTGTDKVEAIVLDRKEDVSQCDQLSIKGLSKLRNLKLLILCHKNFSGSPKYLANELRYLLWNGCPFSFLPLFEPYSSLVELNLPNSSIKQLWQGPKDFPYLKRVDLSNSENLKETPNFECSPKINWLDFTGCTSLFYVHPSIGLLERLAYLSLQNCRNLVSLLKGICKLSSLGTLHLSGCTKLANTPDFTGLPNLKYLDLERCTSLSTVCGSIVALPKLKFLSLRGCTNLVEIPNNVSDMKSLQTLDLSSCTKLKNLPRGQRVRSSSYLDYLILGFRNLRGISPDAFGELRCLERLNLERSYFGFVPHDTTVKEFSGLAYLNLAHCGELVRSLELPFDSLVIIG